MNPIALTPSPDEQARREQVMARVLQFIREDRRILLPEFEPSTDAGGADYALHALGDYEFAGSVGPYRYILEGEDDLLHIAVLRRDRRTLGVPEAQAVVTFLMPHVAPALIWLKPGEHSHHFYVGHDELLRD